MPKISVVMPAYNAEKYIKEAIDSVLNQTFRDFELIVINDCSQDTTENIILSYDDPRIIYLRNKQNLGVAATLNRGISVACGEYIARMDADDIAVPERFQKQAQYLDSHPKTIVCGSSVLIFSALGNERVCYYPEKSEQIKAALLFACPFAHPSVMMRRNILCAFGIRYEEEFEKVEDYRLWSRLADFGDFANLAEPLLRYRIHSEQVCATSSQVQYEGKLRLAAAVLPQIGVRIKEDQRVIVDAFDGRIGAGETFKKFEFLAQDIVKNVPEDLDISQIKTMLKSKIIEIATLNHFIVNIKSIRIIGINAWIYVLLRRIGGRKN